MFAGAEPPPLRAWAARVFNAWTVIRTQRRIGMDGVVGLDYAGAAAVLRFYPKLDQPEVWKGLQVIEAEMLDAIAQHREQRERRRELAPEQRSGVKKRWSF